MKKYALLLIIIILCCLIVLLYYINVKRPYQIVTLKGGEFYFNLTKSHATWIVGNNPDNVSALPLCYNDLISIEFAENEDEDGGYMYRYVNEDGNSLDFSVENFKMFLHNKIISVRLDESGIAYNWLENATREELERLRSIIISSNITDDNFLILEKVAHVNEQVGIYIESDIENASKIFEIFNPTWLLAPDNDFDSLAVEYIYKSSNLEILYIDVNYLNMEKLAQLPKLTTLICDNFEPALETINTHNFIIQSLSIIDSEIKDVSFLEMFPNLTSLNFIDCDSLVDMRGVTGLEQLRIINLTRCDEIADLQALDRVQSLMWFSFPSNVSQDDFETFIANHQGIEVLELIECNDIHNLTTLGTLKKLSCLTIFDTDSEIDPLYEMSQLQYLSIPEDIYGDSTSIAELQQKLPNTILVPSTGFCLGSGWILLLFPILIFLNFGLWYFRRNRSQN